LDLERHYSDQHRTIRYDRNIFCDMLKPMEGDSLPGGLNFRNGEIKRDYLILCGVPRHEATRQAGLPPQTAAEAEAARAKWRPDRLAARSTWEKEHSGDVESPMVSLAVPSAAAIHQATAKTEFLLPGEVTLRRELRAGHARGLGRYEGWSISVRRGIFTSIVEPHVEALFLAAGLEMPARLPDPPPPCPPTTVPAAFLDLAESAFRSMCLQGRYLDEANHGQIGHNRDALRKLRDAFDLIGRELR
jgi:hypothetical protein